MRKVLIANRGEIAVRIIRACREFGLASVAVFSDADTESLHVKLADQAYRIGTGPAANSYLRMDRILEAAQKTGSDAIHPGYGLLSENAEFAQAVVSAGLTFIGPSPNAIQIMGSKTTAREKMKQAKVPIVPGSDGPVPDLKAAQKAAEEIGFPVLIKAVSGGGGRGMRIVESAEKLTDAYDSASREAQGAFGDGRLYLERYLKNPRHIEIQVLADSFGQCIYLGERECSIQRRHQKIIEESPSVLVTPEIRKQMGECSVKAAQAVQYSGAGTVEFLMDEKKNFYFIEMNTRLQVEHPVTEFVYGLDLVLAQLKIAQGEKLPISQKEVVGRGSAIECRICAEDPKKNYRPCPGEITGIRFPGGPGVRIDTHIYAGYEIPIYYDPMICKLITWGEDREIAIQRMKGALHEFQIQGVQTNIGLLQKVIEHPKFQKGNYNINFLDEELKVKSPKGKNSKKEISLEEIAAIAAALSQHQKQQGGIETQNDSREGKGSVSFWKLPAQSWKLTGLRQLMDRNS